MDIQKIKDKTTVIEATGCWIWNKSISTAGYGQLTEDKKYWGAHRYAYTCTYGEIQDGLLIRHSCHTPSCCNPEHLTAGTHKDNYHDSITKHESANKTKASQWEVAGIVYFSSREARLATGISSHSLNKYTYGGVFNINEYHIGCEIGNTVPSV